ncbi:MAG TPA: ABC transporter ATP-binding protein [Methylomirabilota bacterium]|nr:ABC transporter ATP-binding protein [Methylomirabilota bacterium]
MYIDTRLWALTVGVRLRIAAAVLIGLLAVAAGIARLALLGWLLARVAAGDGALALAAPVAATAAVIVLRGVLEYWRAMVAHETAARVQTRLRERLYDHLVALGPAHVAGGRTGDVTLSLVEAVQQLEVYFGQYLPQLFVALLTPPLIFLAVAFLDLRIALLFLAAALFTLIAPMVWHRSESAGSLARSRAYAAFGAELLDAIQGLGTLKAFGQSRAWGERLAAKSRALLRSTMWVLGANTAARGITDVGLAVGAALALTWGAYRVADGALGLPALLVILMLGVEVFRPLRELRALLHQGLHGRSAAEGVFALLAAEPEVPPSGAGTNGAGPLAPTVAFEAVSFRYPGARRLAHDGLSLAVRAGERIGIVGPSGAGKSTVVKLLLRFHDPQGGRVRIGGRDLRSLSPDEIRRSIALVSQDTYLFHGTVEDNLRLGKPDATQAELEAAARAANAHEFIRRLPQGYATRVGERAVRLSGGQRQRIAIARALLRDAPILVLDEALSSVDAESEALVQSALDRLMVGRTTLIVAHRLSSVIGADRILVLEAGRVVEAGAHAALLAQGGVYARLMAGQLGNGSAAHERGFGEYGLRPDPLEREPVEERDEVAAEGDDLVPARGMGWPQALRVLLRLARSEVPRLSLAFVLGVARVAALIGVGVLGALVVAAVRRGEPFGGLVVALLVVAPLAGVLHWLESWIAHDAAYRLLHDMRMDLYWKLESLAPAYLVRRRSGDLVSVATQDVELVEYFFAHTVAPAFVAVLVPLAVLITLGVHDAALALVLLPFLALGLLSPILGRGRIDRLGAAAREASGAMNAHAVDSVQGLGELLAFGAAPARGAAFARLARAYADARRPLLRDLAIQASLQEVATGVGGLAVIWTGAVLVAGGRLDAGLLPLMTLLAMSAFVPIWEIAQVGRQLADSLGAARRLHAVHGEPVPVNDGPGAAPRDDAATPAVELRDVTFTYPGRRRPALADVSLRVPAGSTAAIVGPSGAGKSTVAALLLRFWDPARGEVRYGGEDARRYRLDDLRGRVALVAQDTYLFHLTLRENVALARPDAPPAEIDLAVERAALAEFVAALPDGLETVVGERGTRLSGGQRQRVAIARAFLKDAPVLILDEATSHLDVVNERAVHDALERLARDRTTVIIAHRLSTVSRADQIVVLDEGRVVETGPHAALLARGGLYARLVSRQLAGAPAG